MPAGSDHDECEFCLSSSKRMRTNNCYYRSNLLGNNNNNVCVVSRDHYDSVAARVLQLADQPRLSVSTQLARAWNPLDCSVNVDVKLADPLTVHRHPVAQSTDAVRGRVGFSRGMHMWRIDWKSRERGTHAVVGVSGRDAPLHCHGYCSLVGLTEDSWGWDIIRRRLVHKQPASTAAPGTATTGSTATEQDEFVSYPSDRVTGGICTDVPESIFVLLDMEEGSLAFICDGQYLGVAFTGLAGRTLYPAISAVWGHCEVTMTHLASLNPFPLPLLHLCRFYIRKHLRINVARNILQMDEAVNYDLSMKIDQLNIPEYLKMYLKNGSFQRL